MKVLYEIYSDDGTFAGLESRGKVERVGYHPEFE